MSLLARRGGLGTALLDHAQQWLRALCVRYLQVKTIASGHSSRAYAQTREFYRVRGFTPLEVFPTPWSPNNPVLLLVKAVHAG